MKSMSISSFVGFGFFVKVVHGDVVCYSSMFIL